MIQQSKYDQRGVSADKHEVHEAIKHLDKGLFPNAFCKILPDFAANHPDYCNLMHADTAGTKPSLAYIYWKETGDHSVWKGIVQDAIVMNLDDMAAAGVTNDFVLSSTIGRNKNHVSGEVLKHLIAASSGFAETMKIFGVNIHLAGGETADVGDIVRTLDVGFTVFARAKREDIISIDIKPGDVIVGFESCGQATYETEYNGGMGSNGLTSARHDMFHSEYYDQYPESFDPILPRELAYTGKLKLSDIDPVTGLTYGKLVLSPTRTYLPVIKEILDKYRNKISGIVHNTGGAHTKVMNFVENLHIIKDNLLPVPRLFSLIHEQSGTDYKEMFKVFNMGQRLEIYTDRQTAGHLIEISNQFQMKAQIIGRVESHEGKKLTLQTEFGEFVY